MTQTRKRNAEATRERILKAAQHAFQEKGFDAATTREIADGAGVNLALIKRYFGSKLGLFEKAVLPHLSLEWVLKQDISDLASLLAKFYTKPGPKDDFDAFVVFVRSLASPEAGPALIAALNDQALRPLQNTLKRPDAEARAILITTQLAGLILFFRIMGLPHDSETPDAIRQRLEPYLNHLLHD